MKKVFLSLGGVLFVANSFYRLDPAEKTIPGNSQKNTSGLILKKSSASENQSAEIYRAIRFENTNILSAEVFEKAFAGYTNLKKAGKLPEASHLITIIDFSLSSAQKRLWVIDLENKAVVFNSLVAHGKNTGEEFAQQFSNTENSYQSSLGFYLTETTYNGSNGYSLKLAGMDPGYNDAALQRAIVMHGADYVSEDFIKSHRRIGRSWGCPAVPRALAEPIINTIKGKNLLFIYYPDQQYLSHSEWLKNSETV